MFLAKARVRDVLHLDAGAQRAPTIDHLGAKLVPGAPQRGEEDQLFAPRGGSPRGWEGAAANDRGGGARSPQGAPAQVIPKQVGLADRLIADLEAEGIPRAGEEAPIDRGECAGARGKPSHYITPARGIRGNDSLFGRPDLQPPPWLLEIGTEEVGSERLLLALAHDLHMLDPRRDLSGDPRGNRRLSAGRLLCRRSPLGVGGLARSRHQGEQAGKESRTKR